MAAHLAQGPAVHGRLHEVEDELGVAGHVGKRARFLLEIEHERPLVPGECRLMFRKSDGIEAVIPGPDGRHPVLGHVHGLAAEVPARGHQGTPGDVGREVHSLVPARSRGWHQRAPFTVGGEGVGRTCLEVASVPGWMPARSEFMDLEFPGVVGAWLENKVQAGCGQFFPGSIQRGRAAAQAEHQLQLLRGQVKLPAPVSGRSRVVVLARRSPESQRSSAAPQSQYGGRGEDGFHGALFACDEQASRASLGR